MGDGEGWRRFGSWGRGDGRTYAGGVGAIALVADGPFADDFAVCVGFFVAFDVAGS